MKTAQRPPLEEIERNLAANPSADIFGVAQEFLRWFIDLARRAEKIDPTFVLEPQLLSTKELYWDPDRPAVLDALCIPPENMDRKTLIMVVREMDRRLKQFWDKVAFERTHDLVDYGRLEKSIVEGKANNGREHRPIYFDTVGQLRRLLDQLPNDRKILSQVTAEDGHVWRNMQSEFIQLVQHGAIAEVNFRHPNLKRLPKDINEGKTQEVK